MFLNYHRRSPDLRDVMQMPPELYMFHETTTACPREVGEDWWKDATVGGIDVCKLQPSAQIASTASL